MESVRALLWNGEGLTSSLVLATTAGRLLLTLFFVYLAYQNLSGNPELVADFRRWGYPDWFRIATALAQIVGAILLVAPSTCFLGALLLAVVLIGAVGTHLLHDPWTTSLSPLLVLCGVTLSSVWFRPSLFQL